MSLAIQSTTMQFLTFSLDEEMFALEISRVREVLDYTTIVKVPRMPDFMLGAINLRGSIIPVVDLKLMFGMQKTEKSINTCIIIVEISLEDEVTILGIMADAVEEVFEMDSSLIEPPPRIGTLLRTDFIKGMGKRNEHFVIILDIDRIITARELEQLEGLEESEPGEVAEAVMV